MKGGFHERKKDEPFLPPKTNGDVLRSLPDEELAAVFADSALTVARGLLALLWTDTSEIITRKLREETIADFLKQLREPPVPLETQKPDGGGGDD